MSIEQSSDHDNSSDMMNVDLLDILKKIVDNWKIIFVITAVFIVLALFHTRYGPTEYESTSVLIQESDSGSGVSINQGNLFNILSGTVSGSGGIAAAASGQAPPPLFLYPSIVNSSEFQYEFINTEVEFERLGETMTLFEFFTEHNQRSFRDRVYSFVTDYTIKLPFTLFGHVKDFFQAIGNLFTGPEEVVEENTESEESEEPEDDRLLQYSSRELSVMDNMRMRITLTSEGGLITIAIRLPDPKAAAQANANLLEIFEEELTEYRLAKANRNLDAIQQQYEDAQRRYEAAQNELANYLDQNQDISTERGRAPVDYLQDIRNTRSSVHNELSLEVERARLNVEKETPIFQVLDKPGIPTSPYAGLGNLIVIFAIILGVFTGVIWVFLREAIYALVRRYRA